MKKIIVVGYPKSGNTWVTRLTASLLDCPVKGYLYSDHNEIAIEGEDRKSQFGVFKSHHHFSELSQEDQSHAKIIYVIRDPRDVSISGRHYFIFGKVKGFKSWVKNEESIFRFIDEYKKKIVSVYQKVMKKLLSRSEMNKAVLYGNSNVHRTCSISWKAHLSQYRNKANVFKVQYESLLNDSFNESKRILDFIGIEKSEKEIIRCINEQSFDKRKTQFFNENQIEKANFLRSGKKEQWKTVFSKKENRLFVKHLKKELIELGYDLKK